MPGPDMQFSDLEEREAFLIDASLPFWERIPALGSPRAMRLEGGLLLTRFEDCRAVLASRTFQKANIAILESMPGIDAAFVERRRHAILDMEGLDHMRLRKLAMPALSPAASDAGRPYMRQIIGALIDQVAADGGCDAAARLCRPYPIPVICAVLGVPSQDIDFFTRCAEVWTRWVREGVSGVPAAMAAHQEMDGYLGDLVGRRRQDPREDLITELIRSEEDGDRLTSEEIIHLVASLIIAGTDTTRMALGSALYLFAQHPDQWAALAADPTLAPAAAEEVLRYAPVSALLRRTAVEDADLDGLHIPAGASVFISPATANRDPDLFPDPETFSIRRDAARAHLTFGGGRKHCLGAHLSRAELQEALVALSQRLPNLALDGEPAWTPPRSLLQGAVRMPVRWTPT